MASSMTADLLASPVALSRLSIEASMASMFCVGGLLHRVYGAAHFLGGAHGLFRELANLVGNNGESPSGFPGASGLDGRVQRQQIGLIGYVGDDVQDAADGPGLFAQLAHAFAQILGLLLGRVQGVHGLGQQVGPGAGGLLGLGSVVRDPGGVLSHFQGGKRSSAPWPRPRSGAGPSESGLRARCHRTGR